MAFALALVLPQIYGRLFDAERASRASAEDARGRLDVIARASSILSSTLQDHASIEAVTRLLVPQMCDWCAFCIGTEPRAWEYVVACHRDRGKNGRRRGTARLGARARLAVWTSGRPQDGGCRPDERGAETRRDGDDPRCPWRRADRSHRRHFARRRPDDDPRTGDRYAIARHRGLGTAAGGLRRLVRRRDRAARGGQLGAAAPLRRRAERAACAGGPSWRSSRTI
jgi:hypothetical protein